MLFRKKKMSRGKLKKRIHRAWHLWDLDKWLLSLIEYGALTEMAVRNKTDLFLMYSDNWNAREGLKHTEGNYPNWNPYCSGEFNIPEGKRLGCRMPRMIRMPYGWKCPECGQKIGKHNMRISQDYEDVTNDKPTGREGKDALRLLAGACATFGIDIDKEIADVMSGKEEPTFNEIMDLAEEMGVFKEREK